MVGNNAGKEGSQRFKTEFRYNSNKKNNFEHCFLIEIDNILVMNLRKHNQLRYGGTLSMRTSNC